MHLPQHVNAAILIIQMQMWYCFEEFQDKAIKFTTRKNRTYDLLQNNVKLLLYIQVLLRIISTFKVFFKEINKIYNLFQNQKSIKKKKSLNKFHFFWVGPTSRQNLTLSLFTQNNYNVQKGGSYHIIPFE
jgi:hypothetical protein